MPKYPTKIKERAQVLRSEGKSYSEIAKELSISRMTVIRWSNKGYLKGGGNNEGKNNEKASNSKDNNDNVNLIDSNSNQRGDNNIEGKDSKAPLNGNHNKTFKGIKVTYDTTGSLILEDSNTINENPPVPASDTSALKPSEDMVGYSDNNVGKLPGLGQAYKKPDSIIKRSYAEILIPIGLVVCGYAMGGKKGSKGSFSEDNYGQEGGLW